MIFQITSSTKLYISNQTDSGQCSQIVLKITQSVMNILSIFDIHEWHKIEGQGFRKYFSISRFIRSTRNDGTFTGFTIISPAN